MVKKGRTCKVNTAPTTVFHLLKTTREVKHNQMFRKQKSDGLTKFKRRRAFSQTSPQKTVGPGISPQI